MTDTNNATLEQAIEIETFNFKATFNFKTIYDTMEAFNAMKTTLEEKKIPVVDIKNDTGEGIKRNPLTVEITAPSLDSMLEDPRGLSFLQNAYQEALKVTPEVIKAKADNDTASEISLDAFFKSLESRRPTSSKFDAATITEATNFLFENVPTFNHILSLVDTNDDAGAMVDGIVAAAKRKFAERDIRKSLTLDAWKTILERITTASKLPEAIADHKDILESWITGLTNSIKAIEKPVLADNEALVL